MNILLINHYAGSPNHGMEYRPFYMAREWVRMGHQVTIVAASHSHLRSRQPNIMGELTEQHIEGIRYLWIKTSGYHGNGLARVMNMLIFIIRLFKLNAEIVKEKKPDIVIASSTYPLDVYPARYIARKYQAKLIYEVHDLWPLSPIELGGMSPWHPFILVMQMAENYAYYRAHKVISMLPKAFEHMIKHGMNASKFVYIPNGIDVSEWDLNDSFLPKEYVDIFARTREDKYLIIGYAGTHGIANSLKTLIEAAEIIQDIPVKFICVGQGLEKENLINYGNKMKLKNIIWLPPVPKQAIPDLLSYFDICFIGAKKQPLYRFGISPNKLMDYMMAAKPIISAIEAGNDLVGEAKCGISVASEDPYALANAIKKIYNMSAEQRTNLGENGKNFILEHHTYQILAEKFIKCLSETKREML